ncbi:DUF6497 family protein [Chachezhania sediminis]|uniref:DUF6497 family protein n=1 Tax=Chachezhania sediminis TaxID=2599291 RepID=UPI001E4EF1EF|nr:DUF6497 family protein [Chachezhania sediminis]
MLAPAGALPAAALADPMPVEVPSGQPVTLFEVLMDDTPGQLWARFRFLAPKIGNAPGRVGYDVTAVDMDWVCNHVALPWLDRTGLEPERIVISFSDRELPLGETAPDAAQYFEFYRPDLTECIWEEY